MKVKYDLEADILIFILRDVPPINAISEPGGVSCHAFKLLVETDGGTG